MSGYVVPTKADVDESLHALVCARRTLDGLDDQFDGLERTIER